MNPNRYVIRSKRRGEICTKLQGKTDILSMVETIRYMPAEFRSMCVLDIEEYLIDRNLELITENPWWADINLINLWESLRQNGLA